MVSANMEIKISVYFVTSVFSFILIYGKYCLNKSEA